MARHVGTLTGDVELTQHSVDKAEAILAELLRDRVIKLNVNVAAGQAEKAGKQAEKDAERAAGDIELGVTLKPGEAAAAGKTAEKEAEAAAGEVELKPKVDKTKAAAEGAAASKVAETAAPPVKIKTKVDKKQVAAEVESIGEVIDERARRFNLGPVIAKMRTATKQLQDDLERAGDSADRISRANVEIATGQLDTLERLHKEARKAGQGVPFYSGTDNSYKRNEAYAKQLQETFKSAKDVNWTQAAALLRGLEKGGDGDRTFDRIAGQVRQARTTTPPVEKIEPAAKKATDQVKQSAAMRAFREAERAVNEFEASNPNWQDTKKGEREWNRLADRFGDASDKLSPAEAREIRGIKKGQLPAAEQAVAEVKQQTEAVKEHTEAVKKDVAAEKEHCSSLEEAARSFKSYSELVETHEAATREQNARYSKVESLRKKAQELEKAAGQLEERRERIEPLQKEIARVRRERDELVKRHGLKSTASREEQLAFAKANPEQAAAIRELTTRGKSLVSELRRVVPADTQRKLFEGASISEVIAKQHAEAARIRTQMDELGKEQLASRRSAPLGLLQQRIEAAAHRDWLRQMPGMGLSDEDHDFLREVGLTGRDALFKGDVSKSTAAATFSGQLRRKSREADYEGDHNIRHLADRIIDFMRSDEYRKWAKSEPDIEEFFSRFHQGGAQIDTRRDDSRVAEAATKAVAEVTRQQAATRPTGDRDEDVKRTTAAVKQGVVEANREVRRETTGVDETPAVPERDVARRRADSDAALRLLRAFLRDDGRLDYHAVDNATEHARRVAETRRDIDRERVEQMRASSARITAQDATLRAADFMREHGLHEANRYGGTPGDGSVHSRTGIDRQPTTGSAPRWFEADDHRGTLSRNLPVLYRGRHIREEAEARVNHDFYRAPALAIGMGPEHLRGRGPMDSAARAAADARAEALRNWHNTMASTSGDGGSRLGRAISEFRQLRAEARGAAGALKEAERNYHSLREKAMDASDAVRRSSIALHQQRFTLRQGGMSEAAAREHLAPQRLAHEGLVLERETAWRAASTAHRDFRTMRRDLGGSNNGSGGFRGFAKNAVSGLGDALDQVGYHALRFLGISSLVIAALSVIGPLASVAAAGVVGLGAALTVGGVGAASGLLGLSGIIPKVQQLSQARSEQRDPWKVADANHQETTALHALTQARWQESDASTNQLLAQRTLDQSVKDATRNLEDMTRAQTAQRLALEGSSLSAVRARIEMVKAQIQYRHGQITNLDLAEATNRYHVAMNAWEQAKVDKKRFNEDQAIERKRGVRGSTEVIQAQQGMIQANRAVKQAAWASRDAAFQLRKLRHELGYLLGPQEKKSWLDHLFLHTGPKTRELVEMIDRKGAPAFLRLRKASAEALAPGLEEGLKTLVGYEGPITDTFTKFNTVIGDNFAGMMKQFGTNPVWVTFFHNLSKDGPKALNDMLDALGNFGTGFAGVMNGMRPTLKHMMSSIGDMGKSFAHWSKGKEAKDFFKYIRTEGPKIAHDLRDIGGGVKAFFIKLAPFGKGVLDNLAAVGRWLERIDGDKLTQLAKIITLSTGAVFGAKILKGTMGIFGSMGRILGVSPTNPMYVRVVGAWGASGGTPGTGGGTGGSRSGSTTVVGAGGESRQSVRERWRNRGEGGYMALPGGGTGTRTSGGPRVGLRERYGRSGGAAGGIGLAALIGGQMIGGKSGDFVSLVGTGAMLGSMAGPWGAAAGAAIMAAINAPSIGKQIGSSLGNWWNHRNDSNDRAKVAVESINRAGSLDHITLQMETGQLSLEEGRKQLAGIVNKVIGEHHSNGEMGQMTEYNKSLRNANKELQHLQTQQDRTARKARRAFTAFENEMKASGRWAGYIARTRRQVEIMAAETTSAINSTVNSILPWNFAGFKVPNINVNGKTLADSIYTPATHTKHHHYNPYQDLLHGKGSSGRNNLGGVIPGSAYGGTVYGAGTSKSDSVLTRLSVGEEVIQEPYATRNRALLKALNRGMVPVAAGSTAATVPVSSPATVQVEINATSESKLARAIGFEVGIQTKLAQRGGGDWE